ncbi:MAG: hypothetical protein ACTSYI_04350 [Promethearchaeota archaeon]
MKNKHKVNFLPIIGDSNVISFSIECNGEEIFESVIQKALERLHELDPSTRVENFIISTASADLLVKAEFYSKTFEEVIAVYGGSFCIKSPFIL